jgi:hypothetical protein
MKRPSLNGFIITATIMASTLFVMDKCSAAPATASVDVTIPAVFRWADDTQLIPKVDYKHTRVDYGPCSGTPELLTNILGGTTIDAGRIMGRITYVPIGVKLCYVATVVAPDGSFIGRSNPKDFTLPRDTVPGSVVDFRIAK